jgi:hypothetical protein
LSINDVDVFVPFYTCAEGREKHLYLLKRCIESIKREGAKRLYVIDGSPSTPLKSGEIDAEILRNEKHALAFAVNMAIEHAQEDLFVAATGSIFGVGTLRNMIQEKRILEEQFGKPVALYGQEASYPTEDQWLLQSPMAGTIETVKKELDGSGFKYTNEGIAIAKEPRTDWKTGPVYYARTLGVGYLANKDRLFQIGGADERCYCIDYDTGMRWISFGWLLLRSDSVRIHRVCGTTNRGCYRERRQDEIGTYCHHCGHDLKTINATKCPVCNRSFPVAPDGTQTPSSFNAWMKWLPQCSLMELWNHHAYGEPLHKNPSLYRESLRPFYKAEYDLLRKKPFFLGRKNDNL